MGRMKGIVLRGLAQFASLWQVFLFLYFPILVLFILLGVVSRESDHIHLSYFMHDVIAIAHLPPYAGMVSQLGLMFWTAAATICMFTVPLLGNREQNRASKRFLIQSAFFTTFLLLDDTYMFHEDIVQGYFETSEKYIYVLYVLFYILILFSNREEILASEYLILAVAMALFAISTLFDAVDLDRYEQYGRFFSTSFQSFLEDGFKFAGITTWLVYFARYSIQKLRTFNLSTQEI